MEELWIIYGNHHDTCSDNPAYRMLNEALSQGISSKLMFYQYFKIKENKLFYKEQEIDSLPKIVFMRCFELDLCFYFEKNNVRVVNSFFTTKTCRDKWLTHEVVNKTKARSPKTLLLNDLSYEEITRELSDVFILKYRHGAQGNNIFIIHNKEEFEEEVININRKDYIVQEYIKSSFGKDVRAYVIGKDVIGCCLRENKNGFMSNLAQGGLTYPYDMCDSDKKIVTEIADKLKGDIISVDFLIDGDNLIFCEANTNAGFASFNYLGYEMRYMMIKYIKSLLS